MKARKSNKKSCATPSLARPERETNGVEDDAASEERCPARTYFRYPATARRREPVRFYR